jgi:hypothetical protein
MVRYLKDDFYRPPGSQLWDPTTSEDIGIGQVPLFSPALPAVPPILPQPADPANPFGPVPNIQPPQSPFRIWRDPPILAPNPPTWPVPTLPSPPTTDPFPDPSIIRLPPISPSREPAPHDLNPSDFPGQGRNEPDGGLLGILRAVTRQGRVQPGANSPADSNGTLENNLDGRGSPLSGLLDRLFALRGAEASSTIQPSRDSSSDSQKPCRCLSRRLAD